MKRRILCVICLLLYILAACTILSLKIEPEMIILVDVQEIKGANTQKAYIELPMTVLFDRLLYEVVEGTGWDSGPHVQLISYTEYTIDNENEKVLLDTGVDRLLITSASRNPVSGELAEVLPKKQEKKSDQFLFVYPNRIPHDITISRKLEVIEKSSTAILAVKEETDVTFLEHQQKGQFAKMAGEEWRIFSMDDLMAFWQQVPFVVQIMLFLLGIILLWIVSFVVSTRTARPGWLFVYTGSLSVLSLLGIQYNLNRIDFPSSMLPDANILHLKHYIYEQKFISQALEKIPTGALEILRCKYSLVTECYRLLWIGLVVVFAAIVIALLISILTHQGWKYTRSTQEDE